MAPSLAILALGLALLPGFAEHLSSDGVSYLSIAGHYADGRFDDAVNGYWSPLLSWLLAPLAAVGVPGPLAFKVANLGVAVGALAAVRRLARALQVSQASVTVVSWALVAPLVAAAYTVLSPDLLVAVLVLAYLDALVRAGQRPWWQTGLLVGLWASLGYLAKLFMLPFVAVHLLVAVALLAWRHSRVPVATMAGAAVVVTGVIAGGWTAVLFAQYGAATPGTAASVNLGYLQDGSAGAHPLWIGLLPPPHEHAVSAWENIVVSLELAAEAAPDLEEAGADPTVSGREVWAVVGGAFARVGEFGGAVAGWTPVLLLAAVTPGLMRAGGPRRRRRHPGLADPVPVLIVGLAAMIWSGGVLLTHVQPRYLWAALLPLAALAALALDGWRTARPRDGMHDLAALVLVVGLLPWPGVALSREWRATDRVSALGAAAADTDLAGARVATLTEWVRGIGLCYSAGCRYYGVPRSPTTLEDFREEIARYGVEYIVSFDEPAVAELGLGEPAFTVAGDRLRVYEAPEPPGS